MQFRIRTTGALVTEQALRELFPQTSLPATLTVEVLDEYGADRVEATTQPSTTAFQTLTESVKQGVDGMWRQVWVVADIVDAAQVTDIKAAEEQRVVSAYPNTVQQMLDAKARERQYDDIKSAALRAAYPGPFHDEGVKYAVWMDACWERYIEVVAEIKAGTQALVTSEELLATMPELEL